MCDTSELVIFLPFPPTVNSYYSSGHGKVRYVSAAGKKFRNEVVESVNEQCSGIRIDSRINLEVILYPPDRRKRDLDNYMKALLDAVTHSGLWADDELIDQLSIYRGETQRSGISRLEINLGGPIIPFKGPRRP